MTVSHTISWSYTPSGESFQGRVERIAIYLQNKILEIRDSNDSVFYLIYFKNILLGGGKIDQLKQETFLYEAFEQGILLHPSHPLYSAFLPQNQTAVVPNLNRLFTQLQDHLSLQEIAFTATCMDSYIEKQQLITIIREIFNHFRRNGQFRKAYLIANILSHFSPQLKTTRELVRTQEFEKYRKLEEENPLALFEQDSLFLEIFFYQNIQNQEYEIKLHQLLQQQARYLEKLVLFIHTFEKTHDFYDYTAFKQLLQKDLHYHDTYSVLKFLWDCSPQHPLLTEDLLQAQIHAELYPEALYVLSNHIPNFTTSHYKKIENILEQIEPISLFHVPNLNHLISQLYPTDPEKKEKLVRQIVISLLKQFDPLQVKTWLEPIKDTSPNLQVLVELDQLESLSKDLDQLTILGELYYKFGLLDQSIDCFNWDMELNPNSIEPIRWLSKIYLEKGMKEEAEGYKRLSIVMAKRE